MTLPFLQRKIKSKLIVFVFEVRLLRSCFTLAVYGLCDTETTDTSVAIAAPYKGCLFTKRGNKHFLVNFICTCQ